MINPYGIDTDEYLSRVGAGPFDHIETFNSNVSKGHRNTDYRGNGYGDGLYGYKGNGRGRPVVQFENQQW